MMPAPTRPREAIVTAQPETLTEMAARYVRGTATAATLDMSIIPALPPSHQAAQAASDGARASTDMTVGQPLSSASGLPPSTRLLTNPVHPPLASTPWDILESPVVPGQSLSLQPVMLTGHPGDAESSSFFTALSQSLTHYTCTENAAGRYSNDIGPSYHMDNCRESVIDWMRHNSLVRHPLLNDTPFNYRRRLYYDTAHGVFCNSVLHKPRDWAEYVDLLTDARTEADEIVFLCAAICFHCEIIVCIQDDAPRCFRPTHASRRIFLAFNATYRHFNWLHLTEQSCANGESCDDVEPLSCRFTHVPLDAPATRERSNHLADLPAIASVRRQQIAAAHCGHTGHPGIHATVAILASQGLAWRGLMAQVTQYIGRCSTCILARIKFNPAKPAISTLRLSSRPLRRWHCDQTGTLTPCRYTGFNRIIAFICEATGYIVLFGSRFGSALEMAISLVHLVGTYGLFDSFHSDNGSENENFILQQFSRITGVRHTNSIPFNPESNGLVERGIQTVKRFLRGMITDGVTDHNSWGFMIPMVQKAINSSPFGPLQIPPSSVIFASLYCPEHFVIPSFAEQRERCDVDCDIADGNHYHPSSNFIHRAAYFQQMVNNRRQELMDAALLNASLSPAQQPALIAIGSQVLIPWPSDTRPTSMHPLHRGPYIVLRSAGNVLSLHHAASPLPDDQPATLRWSSTARVCLLDSPLVRSADDPSASNAATGIPFQRSISCVLDHSLSPTFASTPERRFDAAEQVYRCRLHAVPSITDPLHWIRTFPYWDIRHTLAFDSYVICHPALIGHLPISNMPATWDPVAAQ